ncbi:MAG: MBL fold metallo-hydrolase [Chlamydiia bacterium]|nr:MBL fold metallo-hydrolase [Chlamydiia bacterium]
MRGFCPLASGSKGNAIYVGTDEKKILIDAGISCKLLKERLSEIGVGLEEIDAVLVTHEHTDHIAGLSVLTARYQIPIIANVMTAREVAKTLKQPARFKFFTTGETFEFGDMEIHPFAISHDTVEPVAFTITTESCKMGFCADLGYASTSVVKQLKHCHYLYLEANHTPDLVHKVNRPQRYKERVLGQLGHLSNEACGRVLGEVGHTDLKHVHLAHLSSECNTRAIAMEEVLNQLGGSAPFEISIAEQAKISQKILF